MVLKVILVVGSYLLGSVCFGYVVAKFLKRKDFGKTDLPGGAGSIRQLGRLPGSIVGILDVTKGAVPILVAKNLSMGNTIIILSALAVVAGHNWPIFFRFRGGGGLASTIGVLICLMPKVIGIACIVGVISGFVYKREKPIYLFLRRVNPVVFGAIIGFVSLLILTFYFEKPFILLAFLLFLIGMVRVFHLWVFPALRKKGGLNYDKKKCFFGRVWFLLGFNFWACIFGLWCGL
jgi:glycerol-3-phosphate acyltransferase PlsY